MNAEQEIQGIVRRIVEGYRPLRVILFGSYYSGTQAGKALGPEGFEAGTNGLKEAETLS